MRAVVHLDLVPRLTTSQLIEAVESGLLTPADLDLAVSTVLRTKFELGLFERPYVDLDAVPDTLDSEDTRALARRIAEQSIVLLRNEPVDGAPLLPLDPDIATIAVIDPNADRPFRTFRLAYGHGTASCTSALTPASSSRDHAG
ncbi:hypothetical protein [Lentzea alba]|uniref:hypothetical protein n=1 Tax=Lentzea alba TaxID=2714351 RepID=UPI001A94BF9F|nr:hypothetical protein [Lentzea alba]